MEHCHSFKSLDCSMVKPGVMVKIEEEELYDPHYDGRSETSTGYPIMNPESMIKEERNEEDSFIRNEEMYEEEESPESSTGHYVKNVVVKRKKDDGAHAIVDQQFEERISSPEPSPENLIQKRWRSARDQFRREVVHYEGLSGSGPLNKKPYMYLQQLMFLKPVLDLRPAVTKAGSEAESKATREHQLGESDPEVPAARPVVVASESCIEPPTNPSVTPTFQQAPPSRLPGKKSKKTVPNFSTVETFDGQVLDFVQRNIEEDPEDAFCRSLGHYIRQVPQGWRLRLRTAIQTLIEGFTPPNNPEQILGLLSQVKLARPVCVAQPMHIESNAYQSSNYILVKIKEEEAGEPYGMNYQRRPIGKGTHRRISMGSHRRISMGREKDGRVHRISSKMVIDIDRLIQMVHDRPELYDPKVPSYADRYKKKKAWDEICSVVVPGWDRCSEKEKNLKVKAIKTRWNSCRDQFRRELTVKGKSTEGRLSKRPYIFTNQLMFLRDILHLRQARDSQEDLPEEESEHSNETQLDAAELDTPSVSSACSPQPNPEEPSLPGMSGTPSSFPDPVPRSSGTRRREQDTTVAAPAPNTQAQIDSRVLDYLKRSSAEGPEDIFLRSLAPHLKRVAPERQLRCQSALMGVIEVFASASDPRELYQAVEYYRAQAEGPSTSGPYSPGPPAPRPSQFRPHESSQSFYSRDRPGHHKPNYYSPPAP